MAKEENRLCKTIGAVTAAGFEPAFLNASQDEKDPNLIRISARSDSKVQGQCGIVVGATFTKEQFALFLIQCQQNL